MSRAFIACAAAPRLRRSQCYGAGLQGDSFFLHAKIYSVVFARGFGPVGIGGADDRRIDHVALRKCHAERQICRLHLVKLVVKRIVDLRGDGIGAGATAVQFSFT